MVTVVSYKDVRAKAHNASASAVEISADNNDDITQVAVKPPTFVIFVNDKELMHFSYTRYIENQVRETFGFMGTPLRFIIRERKEDR